MPTFIKPMQLMSRNFQDAELAVAYLGFPHDEAMSIKLRPIRWSDDFSQLLDAYVYEYEYDRAKSLVTCKKLQNIGMGDRSYLLSDGDQKAMLIEHETGPEVVLLAKIALATSSISLIKEVLSFFTELLKCINEESENRRKSKESVSKRYYTADAITLELRLSGDPKLLNGIELPVMAQNVFEKFLKDGLDRAKSSKEWEGFSSPRRPD